MMPYEMFKQEAYLVIKELIERGDGKNTVDVIERTIDRLAQFFGVSRLAAKIRMVEVGYKEAIGAFNHIDGRYWFYVNISDTFN